LVNDGRVLQQESVIQPKEENIQQETSYNDQRVSKANMVEIFKPPPFVQSQDDNYYPPFKQHASRNSS
jgi:hypothetical protein